jgi:hypothetical protein
MLTTKLVTTDRELDQIADLSKTNLVTNLSADAKAKEGFVTWLYDAPSLRAIHKVIPSVIVKDGDILAAYCLSLSPACVDVYPPMTSTNDLVSSLIYDGRLLGEQKTYYCGQICVAQDYRGQGLVDLMYQFHRKSYGGQFDYLVTEISTPTHAHSKPTKKQASK